MYRYSQQIRSNLGGSQVWKKRLTHLALLILLAVSIIFIILYVNASSNEKKYLESYNTKIIFEIGQATSQMNSLSRTGGSGTSNLLGKIRQRIYAIEILQEQNDSVYGIQADLTIEDEVFQKIYRLLDSFDEQVLVGKQTNDVQNQLNEAILALQDDILKIVQPQ